MKRKSTPYKTAGLVLQFRKDQDLSTEESMRKAFFENLAHANSALFQAWGKAWDNGWRPNAETGDLIITNAFATHEDFDLVIKWSIHAMEEEEDS